MEHGATRHRVPAGSRWLLRTAGLVNRVSYSALRAASGQCGQPHAALVVVLVLVIAPVPLLNLITTSLHDHIAYR
jgi:hypothetical protein